MTKARDLSLAAKAPIASPVFTGNVGVGVTPANNATPASGVQVGATASIGAWESGSNIITTVASNSYYNSAYKYITTNTAALIRLINGAINFNVAPSGSANAAISWTTAMNINAAGIVTMPLQPAFSARGTNSWTVVTNAANQPIVMGDERVDKNNDYNPSTYKFTAPVAGTYLFTLQTYTRRTSGGGGDYIYIGFNINNAKPTSAGYTSTIVHYQGNGSADLGSSVSAIYALSAGDTVHANINGSSSNCAYHGPSCSWGGHLIG